MNEQLEKDIVEYLASARQGTSLLEALLQSTPATPTKHCAYKRIVDGPAYAVFFDGSLWEVLFLGIPFPLFSWQDLVEFLCSEGVGLTYGWYPSQQR